MKYIGIGIVIVGVLMLASYAFDFQFHPIFYSYPWLGFIPVALGIMLLIGSEKGIGA